MSHRKIILIIIGILAFLGIVAIVVGPYIYRDAVVGEAPPVPAVNLPESSATDETVDSINGKWVVASDSYAGYRVNEVLRGVDVTVVGRTSQVSGQLDVSRLRLQTGTITVDVGSIATTEPARDSYFQGMIAEVSTYPTAKFELTDSIDLTELSSVGVQKTIKAVGKLTIHGVARPVTVDMQAGFDGSRAQVAGSIPVVWDDYDITAPNLGFVEVEPTGYIEFLINIKKEPN